MSVLGVLEQLGGVATRHQLIALTSRAEVEAAIDGGVVTRVARGRYALPAADEARVAAHRLTGVVGLLSAALLHGWQVKAAPSRPQVVVPRGRNLTPGQQRGVEVVRAALDPDDVVDGVTSADRTLVDCGRRLAFDEALAVFDSALRGGFPPALMRALAIGARGPGARRLRRLAEVASPLAANPFESVLRAIALDVAGLRVRPQVPIYGSEFLGRPDLVDDELRIILEADSFEWHGGRAALAHDARRYNRLVVNGWWVLRFAWEDVMFDPDHVREILVAAVDRRSQRGAVGRRTA